MDTPSAACSRRTGIDVWIRAVRRHAEDLQLLCAAEQARASRITSAIKRDQFVTGRACAREVLSRELGGEPRRLPIAADAFSKPHVANVDGLDFSVSHSGDLVVLAVGWGVRLGIDTEMVNATRRVTAISERFFSEGERKLLAAATAGEQIWTFHRIWTCKEAYLKALGIGLPGPLRHVSVSPAEGRVVTGVEGDDASRWRLAAIKTSERHTTSVCYESHGDSSVPMRVHDER